MPKKELVDLILTRQPRNVIQHFLARPLPQASHRNMIWGRVIGVIEKLREALQDVAALGRRVSKDQMTADRIASEALRLLEEPEVMQTMRTGLAEVAKMLRSDRDPMETAADWVEKVVSGDRVHAE